MTPYDIQSENVMNSSALFNSNSMFCTECGRERTQQDELWKHEVCPSCIGAILRQMFPGGGTPEMTRRINGANS